MDLILGACAGIALAAACGFRVFVPLLVMGIAGRSGSLELASSLEWVASWPAILMFGAATAVEIAGYYVPWIDNLLDTIATPGAVVAGTIAAAAAMPDVHPAIQWAGAIIGGGGSAAVVQTGTVLTRALSSGTTGGLGNPVVSTGEAVGSLVLAIVAIVVPILAAIAVVGVLVFMIRRIMRWLARRADHHAVDTAAAA